MYKHIQIDDDFQFNLYQDAQYSKAELLYLIRNLGGSEFVSQIEDSQDSKTIKLYKKIDLLRLSKGERQIFRL